MPNQPGAAAGAGAGAGAVAGAAGALVSSVFWASDIAVYLQYLKTFRPSPDSPKIPKSLLEKRRNAPR